MMIKKKIIYLIFEIAPVLYRKNFRVLKISMISREKHILMI